MIDIKWLREHPDAFDASLQRRGWPPLAGKVLAYDQSKRAIETDLQKMKAMHNQLSRVVGRDHKGNIPDHLKSELSQLKEESKALEEALGVAEAQFLELFSALPNVLADDVPDGVDESHNRVERTVGELPHFSFAPRPHDELGEALGMDFETAARLSGARFVVLHGSLARLERALAAFMLDLQTLEHGYTEVAVPYLVREQALFGTGQLPKMREDLFRTTADLWLIPTSEVPLANLAGAQILEEESLPRRYTACTPCFRAEAGAAGKDTRGMIRQHQFTKVELVSITTPEQSASEHERMLGCAEEVLRRLELPYRVVTLCAGDTGAGARKTYDLEVWLPGQGRYREISSCSNCGDYQARRMDARCRPKGEKGTRFVHTLNGSGLAVGRTLIAILENGQQEDGSIVLPMALRPYLGQLERLAPDA
jgi:seryl-tRNA synthetase